MELINELEEGRKAAEYIRQFLRRLELAEEVLLKARDAVSTLATLQEQTRVQEAYHAEVVSKREQEYAIVQELFADQQSLTEAIEAERARRLEAMRIELDEELGRIRADKEREIRDLTDQSNALKSSVQLMYADYEDLSAKLGKHRDALRKIANATADLRGE